MALYDGFYTNRNFTTIVKSLVVLVSKVNNLMVVVLYID